MKSVNITQARKDIYNLVGVTNTEHEPIIITSKRGNSVLLAEDDWSAIQETLYLMAIPGMTESIIEGGATSVDECEELDWDIIE